MSPNRIMRLLRFKHHISLAEPFRTMIKGNVNKVTYLDTLES